MVEHVYYVQSQTGQAPSVSGIFQEALTDYLAEPPLRTRTVERTAEQRRRIDTVIYELRGLRRSLRNREGREATTQGQTTFTN